MSTSQVFTPVRGMSYVLTKRVSECTPEEREYKQEYGRWIKERFMARHGYEAHSNYCSEYGKQYYAQHRREHIERVKQNARKRKEESGVTLYPHRGRPNTSGISVATISA